MRLKIKNIHGRSKPTFNGSKLIMETQQCEICSKLTKKTPGRCNWRSCGVPIVKFEQKIPCSPGTLSEYLFCRTTTSNCFPEYLFLIGIHSMQGWTATIRHRLTRKRSTKILKHTGNLFTKNLQLIGVC